MKSNFQNKSSSRNAGCIREIVLSAVVVTMLYAPSHACTSCFERSSSSNMQIKFHREYSDSATMACLLGPGAACRLL